MEYTFYYKILLEAKLAEDRKGNPDTCYASISLESKKKLSNDEKTEIQKNMKKVVAELAVIKEEYNSNTN